MATTTPRKSNNYNAAVRTILKRLNPSAQAVFLPYTDVGAGHRSEECHLNVLHQVREHGGHRVNGWIIWENRRLKVAEAEFHCGWRSPADGKLYDITPRVDHEDQVLFVPDPQTRIRLGPSGQAIMMPSNRTTIPGQPYSGGPSGTVPKAEREVKPWHTAEARAIELGYPNALVIASEDGFE